MINDWLVQGSISPGCVTYIDVLEDLEPYKVLIQLIQEGLCTYTSKVPHSIEHEVHSQPIKHANFSRSRFLTDTLYLVIHICRVKSMSVMF